MTFSEEREFVKKYEENKNLALQLLAEIGACKITPLTSIPLKDFEIFKQLICLQAWLKENRNEYLKLQYVPGRDMGRFSIHLIHLDRVIDKMVKSVVICKNPHTINTHNKEEPMDNLNWKEQLKEILKLMSNLNATREEIVEIKKKLRQFAKDLQDNKFTNLTQVEKLNLTAWCDTFVPIAETVIERTSIKYN